MFTVDYLPVPREQFFDLSVVLVVFIVFVFELNSRAFVVTVHWSRKPQNHPYFTPKGRGGTPVSKGDNNHSQSTDFCPLAPLGWTPQTKNTKIKHLPKLYADLPTKNGKRVMMNVNIFRKFMTRWRTTKDEVPFTHVYVEPKYHQPFTRSLISEMLLGWWLGDDDVRHCVL